MKNEIGRTEFVVRVYMLDRLLIDKKKKKIDKEGDMSKAQNK